MLEDPPWRWPERTDEEHAASIEKFRQRILLRRSMTTEQMIDYGLRENPGMALWDKSEFAGWSEAKRRVHENAEEHLGVHLFRFSQIAPRITCPALLLRADPGKGGSVTEEVARRVCALNPRIEVVHIAQAGHNIRREAFEQYLAAVSAFLSRVAVLTRERRGAGGGTCSVALIGHTPLAPQFWGEPRLLPPLPLRESPEGKVRSSALRASGAQRGDIGWGAEGCSAPAHEWRAATPNALKRVAP